jgi:biopolymer transport protein ExbB/TolQ
MKTAYNLARELIEVMADIDRNLDAKSNTKKEEVRERLDKEIDQLEIRMYEIKNVLKNIDIK